MSHQQLKRGLVAGAIALGIAALLASLMIFVFIPIAGDTTCPIWAYPVRFSKSLAPDAKANIACMDNAGHLHDYGNATLLQWSLCFGPVFLISFLLLFFVRRTHKRESIE
jgi:hypothetical protein